MPQVFNQVITDRWAMYHGDCIEVLKGIPENSIHYSIFSPPFASLYTYSNSERDMGNCKDEDFLLNMSFLVQELYRVMMPGRLISIHCMDIPAMKERDGYIGLKDFPGDLLRTFIDDEAADFFKAITRLEERRDRAVLNGEAERVLRLNSIIENMNKELSEYQPSGPKFIYHSKVVIWKDPLVEATRTKAIGLLHKQIQKDSALCRQGLPDYLITLRKPGDNPEPVAHPEGFTSFVGENEPEAPRIERPTPDPEAYNKHKAYNKDPVYSHQVWRRYASPVWMDIRQSNTLNRNPARDERDERHICPLQLDVIERAIHLWTNPNDIVLSPFAGIGSEVYSAIKMGRRGIGIELKNSYYEQAVINCRSISPDDDMSFLD